MDTADLEQFFVTIWATTVKKAKSSLDPDDRETVEHFKTWEDIATKVLAGASSSLALIRPALSHLHVFTKVFEAHLGPNLDASYLWGTLACLLQLVARNQKALGQVPRMIKSLAFKAEAFNGYFERSPVASNAIKEVCFDMQLQFSDFFTTSIKHIRAAESGECGYSPGDKGTEPQQHIQRRYEIATLEFGEALSRLEKLINVETSSLNRTSGDLVIRTVAPKQRCIILPPTKTSRLFDRLDIFVQLDDLLTADAGQFSLQSVALHGIGGVGKSSVVSAYAAKRFADQIYDVVLWIAAEKEASLRQSFSDIALRLKLLGARPQLHHENRVLVHDWLQTTECKWLIIYDNAETASMIAPYWPRGSAQGRAIITTRNRSLAFDPAASGLEITSWDPQTGAEFLLFLLKQSIGRDMHSERNSARTLSERLSGHALAISQMAGLIYDGEYSIQEFTIMYLQNPKSAHAMDELAALWDFAFQSLDSHSFLLLGIISFLMPDNIPPEIFDPVEGVDLPPGLQFLKDKLTGFSAALRKLTTQALIKRDKDSGVLTVHRLIQTQFRYFLSLEQRQKTFNNTVELLSYVMPKSNIEKGQLYDEWENYNRYLQHVLYLRDAFDNEKHASRHFEAPQKFCEMLIDYQRFLYELCAFEECERTCAINRIAVLTIASEKDKVDLECSIISHQAQVAEKLGNPDKAIELCQQEINVRLSEHPRKKILLAFSNCNLGIIYSSANDFPKALDSFHQSRQWWEEHFTDKGNTRKYGASILVSEGRCMIGLNEFDQAKEMLDTTIAQVKEEKPLNFGTLAYAHFCYGTLDRARRRYESAEVHFIEAQNSWLRGDQTRLHPFNAGIMYKIGACSLDQGKVEASIKHIKDSLGVTEIFKRLMPVEHGRNLFKLSEALIQNGEDSAAEAAALRDDAESYLRKKRPDVTESGLESAYDDLIPVYWR